MPDQKTMWRRCLGEFSVMWVTKLMISQVKKRIFCPKTTKFNPKLAFLVNLGQAMQAYLVPCWWVDWWLWRTGCISQDTYLLYMLFIFNILERNTARAPQPQTNQPFLWSTFLVVATTCLEYRMGLFLGPKYGLLVTNCNHIEQQENLGGDLIGN